MRSSTTVVTRPRYGLLDLAALLWRELFVMLGVFLAIAIVAGVAIFLLIPRTYTANASLFVRLGQEYVYEPRAGDAARGAVPEVEQLVQSEAAILNSEELKRRVIAALGLQAFEPRLGDNPSAVERQAAERAAIRALGSNLSVGIAPQNSVVSLSYRDRDPEFAARVLNTVIDQYQVYRREVFRDVTTPLLRGQREVFQNELEAVDQEYEQFLAANGIGDFSSLRSALAATYQTTFAERLSVDAQAGQAGRRLISLTEQMRAVPPEVALSQDLNIAAQDQILQLRTERESLLSRYQPDAQPVQDIEARITQLEGFVASGTAIGPREMRVGPNPIWVDLETQRINTQAEHDALVARRAVLDRQLSDLRDRQTRMTELESRNATLSAQRDVLTTSIREFTSREAQSRASSDLARGGADSVTVIERASPPTRGSSMKFPLMLLALMFAGFTALCVGLVRIFSRRGFITQQSVSRTLDLPVLAVAPVKAH